MQSTLPPPLRNSIAYNPVAGQLKVQQVAVHFDTERRTLRNEFIRLKSGMLALVTPKS